MPNRRDAWDTVSVRPGISSNSARIRLASGWPLIANDLSCESSYLPGWRARGAPAILTCQAFNGGFFRPVFADCRRPPRISGTRRKVTNVPEGVRYFNNVGFGSARTADRGPDLRASQRC